MNYSTSFVHKLCHVKPKMAGFTQVRITMLRSRLPLVDLPLKDCYGNSQRFEAEV